MTWQTLSSRFAQYVGWPLLPTATRIQASDPNARIAASSGPAMIAEKRQRFDGLLLLVKREALASELRSLNLQSRCKEASCKEVELRRVTTDILRGGK